MLEPLRFFVDLVPFHAEDLTEHAFNEVVPQGGLVGDVSSRPGKPDNSSSPTSTRTSRLRRFRAMVTAGADTSSQCASRAGITRCPSAWLQEWP